MSHCIQRILVADGGLFLAVAPAFAHLSLPGVVSGNLLAYRAKTSAEEYP
jgi:hypothetical protein